MNIKKLEKICASTCFRVIDNKLLYPNKTKNMSFMIMYPTDGYYLTKEQYVSIFEVIKQYQNIYYYISDIEFSDSFIKNENTNGLGHTHQAYKHFNYDNYRKLYKLFENAIYDSDEVWGISIFQDGFAIVYSNDKIIEKIKSNYPNSADLKEFKRFLKSAEILNENFRKQFLELVSKSK